MPNLKENAKKLKIILSPTNPFVGNSESPKTSGYSYKNRFLLITSETIAIVGSFQNGLKLVLIFCEISLLSTEFSLL